MGFSLVSFPSKLIIFKVILTVRKGQSGVMEREGYVVSLELELHFVLTTSFV